MRAWVILFLAIASEVVGTVALKYAVDHFWIYGVAALCFILAFVLLHRVMQEGVNVGVAYGLWASGGVISTALLCLLYTSPSPRDVEESRMPSSA